MLFRSRSGSAMISIPCSPNDPALVPVVDNRARGVGDFAIPGQAGPQFGKLPDRELRIVRAQAIHRRTSAAIAKAHCGVLGIGWSDRLGFRQLLADRNARARLRIQEAFFGTHARVDVDLQTVAPDESVSSGAAAAATEAKERQGCTG